MFQSDIVNTTFGQRLGPWISLSFDGGYNRSSYYSGEGNYEIWGGGSRMEFAVTSNLVASVGATYWNQRQSQLAFALASLERYSVYGGIQFLWPGARRR